MLLFSKVGMIYTKKKIIISLCILLVIILILKFLYNHFINKKDTLENFQNAIDLLDKHKSNTVQLFGDTTSTDIELSINPWTTKLHNLQDKQKVKAIGLYKPLLVINGEKYTKLGDMISTNLDYSPPRNEDTTLLIKKVGSDIKSPLSYNMIVNFGNVNIPSYYYQYDKFLDSQNNLSIIMPNITNCIKAVSNLNQILLNNQNNITTMIKTLIKSQINLVIGSANPINLNLLTNMSINSLDNGIIQTPISATTDIILPLGIDASITTQDTRYNIKWETPLDINKPITVKQILDTIQLNSIFRNLTENNIILDTTKPINIFSLVNQSDIIDYLKSLCNDILTIFNQTNINPEFINYLKLGNSLEDVNMILSTLSTLHPSDDVDNVIANNNVLIAYASANPNTLLGSIINLIINKSQTYTYPSIKFNPSQLIVQSSNAGSSIIGMINGINDANGLIINNFSSSILDSLKVTLDSNNTEIKNISSNVLPNLNKMFDFQTALNNNTLDYFPLQIYEPIAPPNYKVLGHVFCNTTKDYYKITTANNIACVPLQCVKEIRDWVSSDKVFEYNQSGIYWAIYKNPYIGTFIAVNKPQLPEGKVCKVVACVAKCNAIDELQKADECARKYYQINKSIAKNSKDMPDLVASTEENIYLDRIRQQSANIGKLEQRAQQLQVTLDKADIVNAEMNKSKLQDYVDTQKRNINIIIQRLEKDKNTIKANVNIPISDLNNLLTTIQNIPNISQEQKRTVINNIVQNVTKLSNNTITTNQYNTNMNQILKSCPQYDMTGLVKKSVVADVCYGCN